MSETLYVDEHGRGIKLLPGDYTFSIAASPIAADGTIYTVPTTKAQVTVKNDGQDLRAQATFKLKVPSADTVTDDQSMPPPSTPKKAARALPPRQRYSSRRQLRAAMPPPTP